MEVLETLGGRYTLLDELGRGGMAVVWRARDQVLGRSVAVKVLAGRFADDPQSRERIRAEARAAATLSHPNIAQVYDYGEADAGGAPLPYVVMELIKGPTLQERVAAGSLAPRTVFRICGEVAAALAAAHQDGLVHRDIKMANVMVTPTGAKVVDFGIAAAIGPGSADEILLGTPAYLAPERLTGAEIVPASDVYALGVLLFRLLAHEPPWSVESTTQMLQAHMYVEPRPLPPLPGVPDSVVDLVARCLQKDPAARPAAAEVSACLADAAEAYVTGPTQVERSAHAEGSSGQLPRPDRPAHAEGPSGQVSQPGLAPHAEGLSEHAVPAQRVPTDGRDAPGATSSARLIVAGERTSGVVKTVRSGGLSTGERVTQTQRPGPAGPPVRDGRSRRRWPLAYLALGIVTVAIAALAVWFLTDRAATVGADPGSANRALAPTASAQALPAVSGGVATATPRESPTSVRPSTTVTQPTSTAGPIRPTTRAPTTGTKSPGTGGTPTSGAGNILESLGGSVEASCEDDSATLISWYPNSGYTVESVDAGPGLWTRIVFKSLKNTYRMTVTCVGDNARLALETR